MISKKYLTELFDYENGQLIWKKPRQGVTPGMTAGAVRPDGYTGVQIDGRTYLLHVLIWVYHNGSYPNHDIDHINRDKTDSRLENLREVTRGDNFWNTGLRVDNTSGVVGVYRNKSGTYSARISKGGRTFNLGCSGSFAEAVRLRRDGELEHGYNHINSESSADQFLRQQSNS